MSSPSTVKKSGNPTSRIGGHWRPGRPEERIVCVEDFDNEIALDTAAGTAQFDKASVVFEAGVGGNGQIGPQSNLDRHGLLQLNTSASSGEQPYVNLFGREGGAGGAFGDNAAIDVEEISWVMAPGISITDLIVGALFYDPSGGIGGIDTLANIDDCVGFLYDSSGAGGLASTTNWVAVAKNDGNVVVNVDTGVPVVASEWALLEMSISDDGTSATAYVNGEPVADMTPWATAFAAQPHSMGLIAGIQNLAASVRSAQVDLIKLISRRFPNEKRFG